MPDVRVAMFTPLPPQRSGIAEYCAVLLPALAQHVGVTVVVEDWTVDLVAPMNGVTVIGDTDYSARRDDWDLAMYHLGNHCDVHHRAYRELINRPGLTVLHDLDMSAFFEQLARRAPDLPRPASDGIGSLTTIVDASRAVVVHSQPQADLVSHHFPAATVMAGELAGVPIGPTADPAAILRACGWHSELFIVGAFGGIGRDKRLDLVVRAAAALHRHEPALRLLIAGWVFDADYLDELEHLVTALGIGHIVRIVTDPNDDLASCIAAADVVVDLRNGITGATSGTVTTALASGRPVITPDLPMYALFDTPGVMRVRQSPTDAVVDATDRLRECIRDRLATRRRGEAAAQWVASGAVSLAAVAAQHAAHIARACALPDPPPSFVPVTRPLPVRRDVVGELTVIGDLTATTGLMEFCRSLPNVLDEAGFRLDHWFSPCHGAAHSDARDVRGLSRRLPRRREAEVELWLPNINEFLHIPEETLRPPGPRRKVIAVWAWELPVLQPEFARQVHRVDEIWVNSPFVGRTMQRYTSAPVVVIPAPIRVDVPSGMTRAYFGLNDADTIYFFDFDGNSTAARKNPFALIEAFRRAFADRTTRSEPEGAPRLVIKGTNFHMEAHRNLAVDLREHLATVDGVFLEAELTRGEMNALLACCDVYATMHRSEGLGLGMLEAMYLGKPVISPAYPQKWLFPLAEVGCAVRSPLRPIRESDHSYFPDAAVIYSTENHWTEPDVADAARWIRLLYDDPALRRRLGRQAARLMRQYYSPAETLAAMEARLGAHLHDSVNDAAVVHRLVS